MARSSATPAFPTLALLCVSLGAVVAPHLAHLPFWAVPMAALTAASRLALASRGRSPPRSTYLLLLLASCLALVYGHFRTLTGRDAGVALLVLLGGLKVLEIRSPRDVFVAACLGYFLVITNFLYSQEIGLAVYLALPTLLLTGVLASASDPGAALAPRAHVTLAGRLLLRAAVPAFILFLFFPRISGPIWGLPGDAYGGVTGLSDELTPGALSRLSQSSAVAFRVQFEGAVPDAAVLYWRGPVFWRTDGKRWKPADPAGAPPLLAGTDPAIRYSIALEPHNSRWLFSLDLPTAAPQGATLGRDFQLLAPRPIRTRRRYELASVLRYQTTTISPEERRLALELPPGAHPRARQLAQTWRQRLRDDTAVLNQALRHFRQDGFQYTLTPPPLQEDAVDQFLFDTRRGYCEHYATSFAVLMRAAGIPTRVVAGYQGGTFNPLGGYLMVRQLDAHAWTEVWLGDRGWVRVDPTAAVAPERIDLGMQALSTGASGANPFAGGRDAPWNVLLNYMSFGWDGVNNLWSRWVLAYGPDQQKQLFAHLGWPGISRATLGVGLVLLLFLALLMMARLQTRHSFAADPVRRAYQHFCQKTSRKGISRRSAEGPMDFAARACAAMPEHARRIRLITRLYVRLRYCPGTPSHWAKTLRHLVHGFHP